MIGEPTGRGGLSADLRSSTHALHAEAERSGVVADILRGRVTLRGYGLFLRNLLPAYQQLEAGLEARSQTPGVGDLARPEVYRSGAIIADLTGLFGERWPQRLPILAAAQRYADRVQASAAGTGAGLIGHAYVRYLGDLSGGQVLKRCLVRSPGLPCETLGFFEFPQIMDLESYKADYRAALDRLSAPVIAVDKVIDAALDAFELNIHLSNAVREAVDEAAIDEL